MSLKILPLDEYRPPDEAKRRFKREKNSARLRKLEALVVADFRCVVCGRDDELTIHHLTRIKGKRDKREVRCVDCHLDAHGIER